jgi:hypothetical protein
MSTPQPQVDPIPDEPQAQLEAGVQVVHELPVDWPTPAQVIADIHAGQRQSLTLYVRALDWAADQLATANQSKTADEWREWALDKARIRHFTDKET